MSVSPNTIRLPWNNIEIRYKKGAFKAGSVETTAENVLDKDQAPFKVSKDTFITLSPSTRSSVLAGLQEPNKEGVLIEEPASARTGSYSGAVERVLNKIIQKIG